MKIILLLLTAVIGVSVTNCGNGLPKYFYIGDSHRHIGNYHRSHRIIHSDRNCSEISEFEALSFYRILQEDLIERIGNGESFTFCHNCVTDSQYELLLEYAAQYNKAKREAEEAKREEIAQQHARLIEERRKEIYNGMKSAGYPVGEEDDFYVTFANKEDRDWYYNKGIEMGIDLGSREDFEADFVIER
ncbi:MAG: hypothetical protein HDR38_08265 [Treponema sp.]|nr:hypothetical protein [Treponema sp.]